MCFHKIDHSLQKIIFFILFIAVQYPLEAQRAMKGSPESFSLVRKTPAVIPVFTLDTIDTAKYRAEDLKQRIQNRYGVVQHVHLDIKTLGVRTEIAGKGTIWQFRIQSPQTYSLGIHFIDFFLPEGAHVFIYDENHTHILGAFTSQNNKQSHELSIGDFKGTHAIIEYFEPYQPLFEGELIIGAISQSYRNLSKAEVESGTGEIGINCPQGADWQTAKHAVCFITFHDDLYEYLCTGFLINNTRNDGTPYFQTANHCINNPSLASTLIAYFNYENSTCTSNDASKSQSLSGATLVATNQYSDFALLELIETPPADYIPFFAGWDATGQNPLNGGGIHHPGGDPKCIVLDANPIVSDPESIAWYDGNTIEYTSAPNTHWLVVYTAGNTEPGSSGSPLFDQNQRVVGQLHGGAANSDSSDYGKFSLSWNYDTAHTAQLEHWLDPDNSGVKVLDGFIPNVLPVAAFTSPITNVCPASSIQFSNSSLYGTNYNWTVTPSGYQYTGNTDNTSINPQILFNDTGKYTISLKATNQTGTDSISKTNYIIVGNLNVTLSGIPSDSIICGYNLINYSITASGADSYTFNLQRTDKIDYVISSDSIYLSLIPSEKKFGTFSTWLSVKGTQGKCTSTDSTLLIISMPPNDDIQNAINLYPGQNIAYTNFCGSIQVNEPSPPLTNCYSTDSWCQDGGTLQHTIWFIVVGPSGSTMTIDTHGFNDRIALYEADSAAAILSGQSEQYTLVAANDDRSSSDNTALLSNIPVQPGKAYWLQVDGYQGATGFLTIDLISNDLYIFPNPTNGPMTVYISNNQDGNASVKIYSPVGAEVYSNTFYVTTLENEFNFDLSSLSSGLYVMKVTLNGTTMNKKFIILK